MPLLFGRRKAKLEGQREAVLLEEKGQTWLNNIVRAPNKEPWGVTLVSLAWTAGPVTFLAALGGYFISTGEMLSLERSIYFLAYSLIAGLLGLAFKLVYNITAGKRQEEQEYQLLDVIDQLPEIIHQVRDLQLENLSPETRRIEAAGMLLNKLDMGPEWVSAAVEDLSNDATLAKQAEKIEIFRRAGLFNRMRDITKECAERSNNIYTELLQTHPNIAKSFLARMQGQAPSAKQGRSRDPLFIERILSAIENDNAELMTLQDVEEMLTLGFELICSRKIAYLKFDYTGSWRIAKAFDHLEEERNDYRLSRARVNSRLRALASYLNYCEANEDIISAPGLRPQTLLSASLEAIDNLLRAVNDQRQLCQNHSKHALALQIRTNQLEKALELYNEVRRAHLRLGRDNEKFSKAMRRWQKLTKKHASDLQAGASLKRSLIISEHLVLLDDADKLKMAKHLAGYLNESNIRIGSKHGQSLNKREGRRLTLSKAKEIAVEVALALDPYIELHDPQIQRAVYGANAALISTIKPGDSAKTKAGWGEALASEVSKDLAQAAERLAQNLIRYYRVPLSQGTINFLVNTYQADKARLEFISEHEAPYSAGASPLPANALKIPIARNSWHMGLHSAKRELSAYQ